MRNNNITKGLDLHLNIDLTASDILLGDKIIFDALLDEVEDYKSFEENVQIYNNVLSDYIGFDKRDYVVFKDIPDNKVDLNSLKMLSIIDNDIAKNHIMWLNSGKKKMLRARMMMEIISEKNYLLASITELFHLATLIQDDVIDKSSSRRFRATINNQLGNSKAIAISDLLIINNIESFYRFVEDTFTKKDYNESKQHIKEQIIKKHKDMISNLILSEETVYKYDLDGYVEYAKNKTGGLFACSIANSYAIEHIDDFTQEEYDSFYDYGIEFGIVFQIVDDYIDLNCLDSGKESRDIENNALNYFLIKNNTKEEFINRITNLKKHKKNNVFNTILEEILGRING